MAETPEAADIESDVADTARPFIPDRPAGALPTLLPSQRPVRSAYEDDLADEAAEAALRRKRFEFRRPFSDMLLRWLVVVVPLALAAMTGLLGVEFQKHSESFLAENVPGNVAEHLQRVRQLTASMGAICVVGLAAMSLWSWLMVTNTNRVGHSLRTPWFAAIGWLLAPGLGVAAHLTLDRQLESGSLIGLTVFLAVLYLPFGTLGGAADDLGGSAHLSRTWFIASVIGAFLLIVGMSGATSVLPVDNPQNVLKVRAFACYLSSLMLLASSALAFATARNLNALIGHRWALEEDPEGVSNDPKRLKITRRGRKLRRRMTPTLFLRVLVTLGLLGTGLAGVAAMIVFRSRALNESGPAADQAIDDLRSTSVAIGAVGIAVHIVYVVWAVVAARNAYRRSIMAPSPWAVVAAFLGGPLVVIGSSGLTGPFGAAVLTIGLVLTVAGFVVGQLILGRTVSALGNPGRIFLTWMLVDFATALFTWYTAAVSNNRIQTVAFAVAQAGLALLGAALAWTAMTRLDRTCRAYQHGGSTSAPTPLPTPVSASGSPVSGTVTAQPAQPAMAAADATGAASDLPQPAPLALTSSQS